MEAEKPVAAEIKRRLEATLNPSHLIIRDDSDRHRGHAGHDGRGESHFSIEVGTTIFRGKSRLERHRMITEALGDLLRNRIHALSIKTLE